MKTVSEMGGHSRPDTILNEYQYLFREQHQEAVAKIPTVKIPAPAQKEPGKGIGYYLDNYQEAETLITCDNMLTLLSIEGIVRNAEVAGLNPVVLTKKINRLR